MNYISDEAIIGANTTIGHNTVIYGNVVLGEHCTVADNVVLGTPSGKQGENNLTIGSHATIRSHTNIYGGSRFGDKLHVGHHTLVRENVKAGHDLQIGSFNDLEGNCEIADHCRLSSQVHIGKGSKIGNLVWIYPNVVLTNDPLPPSGLLCGITVEDGVVICTGSIVLPGVTLALGSFIAAMTRVSKDVPACQVCIGNPSKLIGDVSRLADEASQKQHHWVNHFEWGYPPEAKTLVASLRNQVRQHSNII